MHRFLVFLIILFFSCSLSQADTPNLLVITVDDMSCDSAGVFDGVIPDLTPNMDQLASEGLRFEMAHVQVGNCYPSRNVMFSGRYPHSSGVEGFYQVQNDYPVFCDVMQKAGYFAAIRGKVSHSTPFQPYRWDTDLTINEDGSKEHIKDVASYGRSLERGIALAKQVNKPFAININISDPHKPFWFKGDPHGVSKYIHQKNHLFPDFYSMTLLFGRNWLFTTHLSDVLTMRLEQYSMPSMPQVKKKTQLLFFFQTMACHCLLQKPNSTTTVLGHHSSFVGRVSRSREQWMTVIWFQPSTSYRLSVTCFMHRIQRGYKARHSSHFFKAKFSQSAQLCSKNTTKMPVGIGTRCAVLKHQSTCTYLTHGQMVKTSCVRLRRAQKHINA